MATYVFHPDAHTETTTVDGRVGVFDSNVPWSPTTPSSANDSEITSLIINIVASNSTDRWNSKGRGIFLFDTSSLPDGATINSSTLTLNVTSKTNTLPGNSFALNVFSANPTSNTALQANDFSTFGSTQFSSDLAYSSIAVGDNVFALNSSGIANISKTGVSKFGIAESVYDIGGSTPTWTTEGVLYVNANMAENGTNKPKLTVETVSSPPLKINIGDVWKTGIVKSINIGDVWKDVVAMWINIGDVWKPVV